MLGDFENQVIFFSGDKRVGHEQGVIYVRQFSLGEFDVHNCADDL
jgi:hypothetical protein